MKKQNSKNTHGFSLLEAIVVISIISVLSAIAITSLANARQKNILTDSQTSIVRALENARSRAVSGVGEQNYCVLIDQSSVSVYDAAGLNCPGPTLFFTNSLPPGVTTDQSPGIYILFTRITGNTDLGANKVITVTKSGTPPTTLSVTITQTGQIFPY